MIHSTAFKKLNLRIVASLTLFVFIFTQSAAAFPITLTDGVIFAKPEFSKINIPEELGFVKEVKGDFSPTRPIFVYIEDAHANYDAQLKTKELLKWLYEHHHVDLAFLEGATSKFNPDRFRFFPSDKLNRELADALARKGLVTGAELFLLEADKNYTALGMESTPLYAENLKSFRRVLGREQPANVFVQDAKRTAIELENHLLNSELKDFLKIHHAYEDGSETPWLFVQTLQQAAKKHMTLDLLDPYSQLHWPQLVRLAEIRNVESALKPGDIEKESEAFLSQLREWKISDEMIRSMENLVKTQLGRAAQSEFGQSEVGPRLLLERLYLEASKHEIVFANYPNLRRKLALLIFQGELNPQALENEMDRLSDALLENLAKTDVERAVISIVKDIRLLERCFRLELSRDEVEHFKSRRSENEPAALLARIASLIKGNKISITIPQPGKDDVSRLSRTLAEVEHFYQGTELRDTFFNGKIMQELNARGKNQAVIITGGYHTPALSDELVSQGASVMVVTPKMSAVDRKRTAYYEVISEKSTRGIDNSHILPHQLMANAWETLARVSGSDLNYPTRIAMGEIRTLARTAGWSAEEVSEFNPASRAKASFINRSARIDFANTAIQTVRAGFGDATRYVGELADIVKEAEFLGFTNIQASIAGLDLIGIDHVRSSGEPVLVYFKSHVYHVQSHVRKYLLVDRDGHTESPKLPDEISETYESGVRLRRTGFGAAESGEEAASADSRRIEDAQTLGALIEALYDEATIYPVGKNRMIVVHHKGRKLIEGHSKFGHILAPHLRLAAKILNLSYDLLVTHETKGNTHHITISDDEPGAPVRLNLVTPPSLRVSKPIPKPDDERRVTVEPGSTSDVVEYVEVTGGRPGEPAGFGAAIVKKELVRGLLDLNFTKRDNTVRPFVKLLTEVLRKKPGNRINSEQFADLFAKTLNSLGSGIHPITKKKLLKKYSIGQINYVWSHVRWIMGPSLRRSGESSEFGVEVIQYLWEKRVGEIRDDSAGSGAASLGHKPPSQRSIEGGVQAVQPLAVSDFETLLDQHLRRQFGGGLSYSFSEPENPRTVRVEIKIQWQIPSAPVGATGRFDQSFVAGQNVLGEDGARQALQTFAGVFQKAYPQFTNVSIPGEGGQVTGPGGGTTTVFAEFNRPEIAAGFGAERSVERWLYRNKLPLALLVAVGGFFGVGIGIRRAGEETKVRQEAVDHEDARFKAIGELGMMDGFVTSRGVFIETKFPEWARREQSRLINKLWEKLDGAKELNDLSIATSYLARQMRLLGQLQSLESRTDMTDQDRAKAEEFISRLGEEGLYKKAGAGDELSRALLSNAETFINRLDTGFGAFQAEVTPLNLPAPIITYPLHKPLVLSIGRTAYTRKFFHFALVSAQTPSSGQESAIQISTLRNDRWETIAMYGIESGLWLHDKNRKTAKSGMALLNKYVRVRPVIRELISDQVSVEITKVAAPWVVLKLEEHIFQEQIAVREYANGISALRTHANLDNFIAYVYSFKYEDARKVLEEMKSSIKRDDVESLEKFESLSIGLKFLSGSLDRRATAEALLQLVEKIDSKPRIHAILEGHSRKVIETIHRMIDARLDDIQAAISKVVGGELGRLFPGPPVPGDPEYSETRDSYQELARLTPIIEVVDELLQTRGFGAVSQGHKPPSERSVEGGAAGFGIANAPPSKPMFSNKLYDLVGIEAGQTTLSSGTPTVEIVFVLRTKSGVIVRVTGAAASGASAGDREALFLFDGNVAKEWEKSLPPDTQIDGYLSAFRDIYGANVKFHDALKLMKKDDGGKGVKFAVWRAKNILIPALEEAIRSKKVDPSERYSIDKFMLDYEGENGGDRRLKTVLSGNVTTAMSTAAAKLGAKLNNMETYEFLSYEMKADESTLELVYPISVFIEGAEHGGWNTDWQEYLFKPHGKTFSEHLQIMRNVYRQLGKLIQKREGKAGVGMESAYIPNVSTNTEPIKMIVEAGIKAGYTPGVDFSIGLDLASSEFHEKRNGKHYYKYSLEGKRYRRIQLRNRTRLGKFTMDDLPDGYKQRRLVLNTEEQIQYLLDVILDPENYISSVEDVLDQDDLAGNRALTKALHDRGFIQTAPHAFQRTGIRHVADDISTSNLDVVKAGIEGGTVKVGSSTLIFEEDTMDDILLKLNQAGTVYEIMQLVEYLRWMGRSIAHSHRGGEPPGETIRADVAIASTTYPSRVHPVFGTKPLTLVKYGPDAKERAVVYARMLYAYQRSAPNLAGFGAKSQGDKPPSKRSVEGASVEYVDNVDEVRQRAERTGFRDVKVQIGDFRLIGLDTIESSGADVLVYRHLDTRAAEPGQEFNRGIVGFKSYLFRESVGGVRYAIQAKEDYKDRVARIRMIETSGFGASQKDVGDDADAISYGHLISGVSAAAALVGLTAVIAVFKFLKPADQDTKDIAPQIEVATEVIRNIRLDSIGHLSEMSEPFVTKDGKSIQTDLPEWARREQSRLISMLGAQPEDAEKLTDLSNSASTLARQMHLLGLSQNLQDRTGMDDQTRLKLEELISRLEKEDLYKNAATGDEPSRIQLSDAETFINQLDAGFGAERVKILLADEPGRDETREAIGKQFAGRAVLLANQFEQKDQRAKSEALAAVITAEGPAIVVVRGAEAFLDPAFVTFAKQHGVRAIIRAGVGVDKIDTEAARREGITVLKTHGSANSVANVSLRDLLAGVGRFDSDLAGPNRTVIDISNDEQSELRGIFDIPIIQFWKASQASAPRKSPDGFWGLGRFGEIFEPNSTERAKQILSKLEGRTIGLVGYGPIAHALAMKLQAIKVVTGIHFDVIALTRDPQKHRREAEGAGVTFVDSRLELFERSSIVSIHLPRTADPITEAELKAGVDKGGLRLIIDTSGGGLISIDRLREPIREGGIIYIGDRDITPEWVNFQAQNFGDVFLTPHLGASTEDAAEGVEKNLLPTLDVVISAFRSEASSTSFIPENVNDTPLEPLAGFGAALEIKGSETGISMSDQGLYPSELAPGQTYHAIPLPVMQEAVGKLNRIRSKMRTEALWGVSSAGRQTLRKNWREWVLPWIDFDGDLTDPQDRAITVERILDQHNELLDNHRVIQDIIRLADDIRSRDGKWNEVQAWFNVGIGGSTYPTHALVDMLNGTSHNDMPHRLRGAPKLMYSGDSFSPEVITGKLIALEANGELFKTIFNIISKSGTTAETAGAYLVIREWLQMRLAAIEKLFNAGKLSNDDLAALGLEQKDLVPIYDAADVKRENPKFKTGRFFVVTTGIPEKADIRYKIEQGTLTDKERKSEGVSALYELNFKRYLFHTVLLDDDQLDPFLAMFPVPTGTGGRFSTFPVALLPLAVTANKRKGETPRGRVYEAVRGAKAAFKEYFEDQNVDAATLISFRTALINYLAEYQMPEAFRRRILDIYAYDEELRGIAMLADELHNEGVVNLGRGLEAKVHIGPNENHLSLEGMTQRPNDRIVWFWQVGKHEPSRNVVIPGDSGIPGEVAAIGGISLAQIQEFSAQGTQRDFAMTGLLNYRWVLPEKTAFDVGAFIYALQTQTAVLGQMTDMVTEIREDGTYVDLTYLQSGVLGYKAQTRELLQKHRDGLKGLPLYNADEAFMGIPIDVDLAVLFDAVGIEGVDLAAGFGAAGLEGIPEAAVAFANRDLTGQNVLARVNINVPFDGTGRVSDDRRLRETIPAARLILKRGGTPIFMGHIGRAPEKGAEQDTRLPISAVESALQAVYEPLGIKVKIHKGSIASDGVRIRYASIEKGAVNVLENVRYGPELGTREERNVFARDIVDLSDGIFIFDAFGDIGSKGASVENIPGLAKEVYVGPAMVMEFKVLGEVLRGFDALVFGGAKLDKVNLLEGLVTRSLFPGGFAIIGSGPSVLLNSTGSDLLEKLRQGNVQRVLTATDYSELGATFDIGPETKKLYLEKLGTLQEGQTVLLNGTMGRVEDQRYAGGTKDVITKLRELARRGVRVVVVGGNASDTAQDYGLDKEKNVILFTGGGVPLKILAGEKLVGVEAIRKALQSGFGAQAKPSLTKAVEKLSRIVKWPHADLLVKDLDIGGYARDVARVVFYLLRRGNRDTLEEAMTAQQRSFFMLRYMQGKSVSEGSAIPTGSGRTNETAKISAVLKNKNQQKLGGILRKQVLELLVSGASRWIGTFKDSGEIVNKDTYEHFVDYPDDVSTHFAYAVAGLALQIGIPEETLQVAAVFVNGRWISGPLSRITEEIASEKELPQRVARLSRGSSIFIVYEPVAGFGATRIEDATTIGAVLLKLNNPQTIYSGKEIEVDLSNNHGRFVFDVSEARRDNRQGARRNSALIMRAVQGMRLSLDLPVQHTTVGKRQIITVVQPKGPAKGFGARGLAKSESTEEIATDTRLPGRLGGPTARSGKLSSQHPLEIARRAAAPKTLGTDAVKRKTTQRSAKKEKGFGVLKSPVSFVVPGLNKKLFAPIQLADAFRNRLQSENATEALEAGFGVLIEVADFLTPADFGESLTSDTLAIALPRNQISRDRATRVLSLLNTLSPEQILSAVAANSAVLSDLEKLRQLDQGIATIISPDGHTVRSVQGLNHIDRQHDLVVIPSGDANTTQRDVIAAIRALMQNDHNRLLSLPRRINVGEVQNLGGRIGSLPLGGVIGKNTQATGNLSHLPLVQLTSDRLTVDAEKLTVDADLLQGILRDVLDRFMYLDTKAYSVGGQALRNQIRDILGFTLDSTGNVRVITLDHLFTAFEKLALEQRIQRAVNQAA